MTIILSDYHLEKLCKERYEQGKENKMDNFLQEAVDYLIAKEYKRGG